MSMFYDIVWREKGSREIGVAKFAQGHRSFLGPGSEKKWYGTHTYKPNGDWNRVADIMMINFSESGHLIFHGSSASERGDLKSKRKGKLSRHFCGDDETA